MAVVTRHGVSAELQTPYRIICITACATSRLYLTRVPPLGWRKGSDVRADRNRLYEGRTPSPSTAIDSVPNAWN